MCEECDEQSSDQSHAGELGEDAPFESKLFMMRKLKQISAFHDVVELRESDDR